MKGVLTAVSGEARLDSKDIGCELHPFTLSVHSGDEEIGHLNVWVQHAVEGPHGFRMTAHDWEQLSMNASELSMDAGEIKECASKEVVFYRYEGGKEIIQSIVSNSRARR